MSELHDIDSDDKLETVDETAAALGIGRVTLYKLMREGKLKAVKIGGATRIRRADRRAFVAGLPTYATRVMIPDSAA